MASDASDIGWGGHKMEDAPQYAREYFLEEESSQSSTYREFLRVFRRLHAMVHVCEGKFVVFLVDAQNLLGVVNRGSPRLILNELARELCWFCLERRIVILVELVPREENSLADELSKLIIQMIGCFNGGSINSLNNVGGGILRTSSRPTLTTSAIASIRCTSATAWRGSTHLRSTGA